MRSLANESVRMGFLKKGAVLLLKGAHLLLTLFLLLGWLCSGLTLWFHVALIPIVVLHWQINQGRCVLSDWEQALKGPVKKGQESKARGHFSRTLVKSITGHEPTDHTLMVLIYGLLTLSLLASLFRLYVQ